MNEKRFSFLTIPFEEENNYPPQCTHLQIALADLQTKICKRVQFICV